MLSRTVLTSLLISASAMAQSKVEPGTYQIDPAHSKVGFEVPHLVISTVEGVFKSFDGKVEVNPDFTKSKVEANVAINSIDTGVVKRDDHLKSADFFDAKNHEKMTFKSISLKGEPSNFKMEGDLTIRGKTKRVVFDGKFLGAVTDGYGNRKLAFLATTKINRKEFGLGWNSMVEAGPVVGDEVTIQLKIQAGRPQNKQASN